MGKKFKDTKLGIFLSKAKDVATDKAPEMIKAAGLAATGNPTAAIATAIGALTSSQIEGTDFLLKELEVNKEIYLAELLDIQDARSLQEVSLDKGDLFTKRFIYFFASALFLFCSCIVLMLFFVEIPKENQRIVDMILGVIVGTGLVSVINFFFGSSQGSKDKADSIKKLIG